MSTRRPPRPTNPGHVFTIGGQRFQGEGTYTVRCSCGRSFEGIAYHADAKKAGDAHVARANAGLPL